MSAFSIIDLDQSQVEANHNLTALYCATVNFPYCFGLCPSPDLAGVGVRVAFYSQSFMNAILIWLSPEDSAACAWASTILTGALVIPAFRARYLRELTLHHATLVLNFATLSTIASVAAAPIVPIWRVLRKASWEDQNSFRQEFEERARGRIILSVALGAQIVLQWAWTVLMFVDPFYDQKPCLSETIIVYFAGFRTATEINEQIASWAFWLLLCFSSSLMFGVVMVFSCPSSVHETPLVYEHIDIDQRTWNGMLLYRIECWKYFLYPKQSPDLMERWLIRVSHLIAFTFVVGFIILSELQISANNLLSGESEIWSFSQSAAVLLALSPIWPIATAWLRKNKNALLPVHHSHSYHCEEHTLYSNSGTTGTGTQHRQLSPPQLDSWGRLHRKRIYSPSSPSSSKIRLDESTYHSNFQHSVVKSGDHGQDGQNDLPGSYLSVTTVRWDNYPTFDHDEGSASSYQEAPRRGLPRPALYSRHRRGSNQGSSEGSEWTLVNAEEALAENVPLIAFSEGESSLSPPGSMGFMERH